MHLNTRLYLFHIRMPVLHNRIEVYFVSPVNFKSFDLLNPLLLVPLYSFKNSETVFKICCTLIFLHIHYFLTSYVSQKMHCLFLMWIDFITHLYVYVFLHSSNENLISEFSLINLKLRRGSDFKFSKDFNDYMIPKYLCLF